MSGNVNYTILKHQFCRKKVKTVSVNHMAKCTSHKRSGKGATAEMYFFLITIDNENFLSHE